MPSKKLSTKELSLLLPQEIADVKAYHIQQRMMALLVLLLSVQICNVLLISTYGAEVDIAAPGGVLRNPDPTKEESRGGILQQTISQTDSSTFVFRSLQGTSMASPHVAGSVALLLGAGAKKKIFLHFYMEAQKM